MTAPVPGGRAEAEAVPLFVDVDGTLIRADLSLENFVRVARGGLAALMLVLVWLVRGRAVAKAMAARRAPVDAARLPYRRAVLDRIAAARAQGRPVVLASASHWRNVARVARHIGLEQPVIATRGRANVKGGAKLAAIRARIGAAAEFDYIGDSPADRCLWRAARRAMTVGDCPPGVERIAPPPPGRWRTLARAARPHQWAKNSLVLVPALTSGRIGEPAVVLTALAAAALLSMLASAVYLINDVLDMEADRAHRTKWARPLAHGDLSIPAAAAASAGLAGLGLAGGWALGGAPLAGWLAAYLVLTTAYSLRLKAVMVGDAIVLASLYTLRLVVGGAAVGVALSYWLVLFSVFLFLSLAYLKRYIEMRDALEPERLLNGRGYVGGDLDVVMMARRGEVEGDPVAFALKDRRSLVLGVVVAAIFGLALYGPKAAL